jgi:hypothetical protein
MIYADVVGRNDDDLVIGFTGESIMRITPRTFARTTHSG